MPIFIKTETIKEKFLKNVLIKNQTIKEHTSWVAELRNKGIKINSGFLIDQNKSPGAGGLLIIECNSYEEAEMIIKEDPMIKKKLVDWEFHEWINVIS